ncbi:hypothetical protein DL95DRAFT_405681 [Leptodontidium sp. 2 PMI_412]|nr:hypothetical protein DL95DRAFT_405681 [Leptodontidium sp. 2 PMI_412]
MDKTTYHSVHESASNSNHVSGRGPRMRGRTGDILFAFSLMTIPMSVFSALLLGLIFYFRVTPSGSESPDLQLPGASEHGNIYVDISATTLTTVASWSSTVAPILVGCAITLISYPVAQQILSAGRSGRTDKLPTPFQLSLMLKMITSGSPQSLWNWIQYAWGWRGKKESQGKPMRLMISILILALMLSTLVFAADTWFHFTTKTINLTQVYPITSALNTSVGLIPDCYNVNSTFQGGCTLNPGGTAIFLMQGPQAQSVVANLSTSMRVNTLVSGKDVFTYVGNPPKSALANVDYQSHSWGLKTQCAPVWSQCTVPGETVGAYLDYKCPFAMEGRISTDSITASQNQYKMTYFTNSTGMSNFTSSVDLANPYYFGALAIVNQNIGHNPNLGGDGEISSTGHGADVFAVYCNTTVYDVKYTSINGSITRFDATPANSTLTNIIQGSQQYTQVGDPSLIQGAATAALISTDSQGVADYFALTYSQIALGIASAAFTPQAAIQAQRRETMLVAKVPIVPLAFLLIANISLALLGIVLLVFASVAARGETREVQARLSVAGLVAAHFEGRRAERAVEKVEDLFEEREGVGGSGSRVGIVKIESGGWGFSVRRAG